MYETITLSIALKKKTNNKKKEQIKTKTKNEVMIGWLKLGWPRQRRFTITNGNLTSPYSIVQSRVHSSSQSSSSWQRASSHYVKAQNAVTLNATRSCTEIRLNRFNDRSCMFAS